MCAHLYDAVRIFFNPKENFGLGFIGYSAQRLGAVETNLEVLKSSRDLTQAAQYRVLIIGSLNTLPQTPTTFLELELCFVTLY
jgi:hypothetical protein